MENIIQLSREQIIFLLKALKAKRIDRDEIRATLGIDNPVLNIEVLNNGIPFVNNEEEIDYVQGD